MSSICDVGDAVELTFQAVPGATVTATWLAPGGVVVFEHAPVVETPASSGLFPHTFVPTGPDVWTAQFEASGTVTAVEQFFIRALRTDGPAPYAVLGDVGEYLPDLTPVQQNLAVALLRRASNLVRDRWRDLDTRIGEGKLSADTVAQAVTNMVLRVMHNPAGMPLQSETVGPFTRRYFDPGVAARQLSITSAEEALLQQGLPARRAARSIMTRPGLAPPAAGGIDRASVRWW